MNLFLFPHQDDEVPVFHEIDALTQAGKPLAILYLTSGQLTADHCAQRNQESLRVLGKLGVKTTQVHFLGPENGIADGALHMHLELLQPKIVELIEAQRAPVTAIYMPAWEGGHQDHDAAHLLGTALAKHWNCIAHSRQFPFYHGDGLRSIFFRTLSPLLANGPPISDRIAVRKRLSYMSHILKYKSQTMTWVGLGPLFALHYLLKGTQILQGISAHRITEKPHTGRLFYERRKFCTFERFQAQTATFTQKYLSGFQSN